MPMNVQDAKKEPNQEPKKKPNQEPIKEHVPTDRIVLVLQPLLGQSLLVYKNNDRTVCITRSWPVSTNTKYCHNDRAFVLIPNGSQAILLNDANNKVITQCQTQHPYQIAIQNCVNDVWQTLQIVDV